MAYLAAKLYAQVCATMPIACVDLLVTDPDGRVLLLKRQNEPAKGQWWTPGGRILLGELRQHAAHRKLQEETGLHAATLQECGTFDVLLPYAPTQHASPTCEHASSSSTPGTDDPAQYDVPPAMQLSHGVTTLYHMHVCDVSTLRVDACHEAYAWHAPQEWLQEALHPFVLHALTMAALQQDAATAGVYELSQCMEHDT